MQKAAPKKSISKFLKRYHSWETIRSYKTSLVKFLDYVFDIEQTHRVNGARSAPDLKFYDRLALDYLSEPRDYAGDLAEFVASLGTAPPSTKRTHKSVVVNWFAANKIFLHPQETRGIRTSGRARTRDRIPTPGELKQIMEHCDLQMRFYLLLLSSTGMRPGEAIQLRWDDIDEDRGRIFVRAEITKNRESRICFMSTEATELYRQWGAYYPKYVEKKDAITSWAKFESDTRLIFPMAYNAVLDKFTRALQKAGLNERDPSTRRHVIHFHGMRKYFRTRLPMGGATVDVTEELMGHEGYLAGSYLRLTEEDLETAYREAEHELWIYKEPPINEEELRHLERENRALQNQITDIRGEVAKMNAATDSVNTIVKAIEAVISDPDNPEALTILLEARAKMAQKEE